ncbi:CoA-transferase family III domain-containing protein [Alternaria rosae]|uniref:CoA-transferase family III domain-containing protein n=1 Tax=Alternaria rosae TaxID=1187941 RepID=UPI001E8E021A|nr:CoA-transferase family III domain-containing protein [Alternaria rosae]KAH6875697.1 CoA-transferase family III domain-containing protein [Alternaria rosae]
MAPYLGSESSHHGSATHANTLLVGTTAALEQLLTKAKDNLPEESLPHIANVKFSTANTGSPYFPSPLKQTEAISALKAVEAGVASAIANLQDAQKPRGIAVDLERATAFLFSTYLATVGGFDKSDLRAKKLLKDTDLLQAQSILYRRLSANLYETKNPGEYFHLHGSLEATKALNMIGLDGSRPDLTDYHECIKVIEDHVRRYTVDQLEKMNQEIGQAGVTCLKWEDFQRTQHGRTLLQQPPWKVETLETETPAAPFPFKSSSTPKPQILAGIRVLELCRIIAGPAMGRGLAEYGAEVIKVTSPNLSDVPFFQVDANIGKHTTDLNLKDKRDRQTFEQLLQSADVILDGYRPGSLTRLGYGPEQLLHLARKRGKGFVYVAENCFGHTGPWSSRPGWQQIADCVTGVAWAQGQAMGLSEPVVPPFPMSDYGTGCMGTIAALVGLYRRAKVGGSYLGTTSLVQYDIYLLQLGLYDDRMMAELRKEHDQEFFQLRHHDSVDEVGKRALKTMRRTHPELFEDRHMQECYSKGFNANVRTIRPVVDIEGYWNGFLRSSRPNGFDKPTWDDWEIDEALLQA